MKKERKWSEAERWSVRESRCEKDREKKKESMEGVNIPSYTVEWRGTERRGALEPWRRCQ